MASLPGSLRLATRRRQIGQAVIYQADCLRVLPDLAAAGLVVDAVITDPPYGLTDNDWDQAPPLSYWWRLTWSLLSPNRLRRPLEQPSTDHRALIWHASCLNSLPPQTEFQDPLRVLVRIEAWQYVSG